VEIKGMNIMDQNPVFMKSGFITSQLSEGDTLWTSDRTKGFLKNNFPSDSSYLFQNKIQWDSISPGFQMPINLRLPYDQHSFNFSFVNQSALGRDKIYYRYILEGEDSEWSDVSPKSISRIYYNLVPGDYTFKVATRGSNGVWSEPATLSFEILPPWWQTWWAYLLFASLFGGMTYAIVYVRSQYLKKENRILEEKVLHRTSQLKKSIDDLKSTQSQLIQSEKMASLGELTAGIAHEIQNPLNFVNNFAELSVELADELKAELTKIDLEPSQKMELESITNDIIQNQQKIYHHGKRADTIVKGMLQHSRAGSGQKELTDINALADEYLRLSYHGLRAKDKSFNADFKMDFDPDLPKINVVPQDLGRVFLNLINNAFYACSQSSKGSKSLEDFKPLVTVSTKTKGDKIEISIKDNGPGIPDAIKDKIFQPFFTTKPTGQGTGLGLSLSYDIVKAHGGELKVESMTADSFPVDQARQGTEFTIILPKL
jgi:signal transduction histidine kinase